MLNKKYIIGISFVVAIVLAYLGVLSFRVGSLELGGTPGIFPADYASSTQFLLPTTGATTQITSTTTACSARIITTGASGVGLTFNSNVLDFNSIGHWQAASTTVSYPAENYGCGVMRARTVASSTLLVTETR